MANVKIQKTPTIRRLPTYLYRLSEMHKDGVDIVATPELARYMHLAEIVIRKDLAVTGVSGQPGVGYKVCDLIDAIRRFLQWQTPAAAILVGAGSLGHALLGYDGFEDYGLKIAAAFDSDPDKIGTEVRGCRIFDIAKLPETVRRMKTEIGIICVPASAAQRVADVMVAAGIRGIWNFANVSLKTPGHVVVQREVIAGGFAVLSVKLRQSAQAASAPEPERGSRRKQS